MPNYGFAIDLRKCIGCHACTIACKAEHEIPVGVNRCWVKTVEEGTFPDTRRFFFPVLCNQCDAAPCVAICPTRALFKRRDGIVDLHNDVCIACRACMAACPYDQLFIDPNTHTAEKCNFCANRVENELLPACVSVCPTECRIFGDLDDPASEVARIVARESTAVRKPEKGTLPKVFYIAAEEAAIRPEASTRPFIYKEGQVLLRPLGAPAPDQHRPGAARVDYDAPHAQPWGTDMVAYLLTKGIATGAMLVCAALFLFDRDSLLTRVIGPSISLAFLVATAVVLIADLDRPSRFYLILTRPNWRSWMVWGAYFLTAQGALTSAWILAGALNAHATLTALVAPVIVSSLATTCYTGFLFAQARARDFWQGPHATLDLVPLAIAEGAAVLIIAGLIPQSGGGRGLETILAGALAVHAALLVVETLVTPSPTPHRHLAIASIRRGALARVFWGGGLGATFGAMAIAASASWLRSPMIMVAAALLALAATTAWEYVWVEAGQSVPLS